MSPREAAVELTTPKGTITGVLARSEGATGGMVMAGGAGGGLHGPAGIYPELAERLQADGISALRLEYRTPNDLVACVYDTLAGVAALRELGVERVVLVGWSFGGAVVITAGAQSDTVVGVATVASQTYGTAAVSRLAPRCLLLLHGTGDTVLPDRCSRDLHARANGPKELILYPDDNHGLTEHREQVLDKLETWTRSVLAATSSATETS
jgi:dienelactone hydrolase